MLLADAEGALWTTKQLAGLCRFDPPVFDRIVVSVDPPVTHHGRSDACGIIVAGVRQCEDVHAWEAVVLEDATTYAASPMAWAEAAIDAMERHGATRLVAEVNQGGDMVATILKQLMPTLPYKAVRAHKGKVARAEPVAALYEQGRVTHLPGLRELEDQMCQMTHQGFAGSGSPDRVDALVWALQDLLLDPVKDWRAPRVRLLG